MKCNLSLIPNWFKVIESILSEISGIYCSKISSTSWPVSLSEIVNSSPDKVSGNIIPAGSKSPESFMSKCSSNITNVIFIISTVITSVATNRRIFCANHYPVRIDQFILFIEGFRSFTPSSHIVVANYFQSIQEIPSCGYLRKRFDIVTSACNEP